MEATFTGFTDSERTLFPREISIDPADKSESLRVQLVVAADPDDSEAVTIRRWFPEAGHDRAPTREQLLAFGWRYLPATRGASASSVDGPDSALRALLQAIDLGTEKARLAGLLDDFNAQLAGSDRISGLRGQVSGHLSKAMPRAVTEDELAVRTAADPAQDVLAGVSMFFSRDDRFVPVTDQSDGLRQLMSMTLFDLAEGTANVVAIDEPELHLHPASQRTVAELLVTGGNQKILVTHSPYIIQRFEPSQVVAVSPDGTCHQIPAAKLSAVEKERANWWSPRLLEALTARRVIIVEGVSDRVIVERAARLMGISLDRLGAMVLEIDGADKFSHVYRLLGETGFCVPVLGLVDEAEKMRWHGQIGGKTDDGLRDDAVGLGPRSGSRVLPGADRPRRRPRPHRRGLLPRAGCPVRLRHYQPRSDHRRETGGLLPQRQGQRRSCGRRTELDAATAAQITSVHGLLTALRALGTP